MWPHRRQPTRLPRPWDSPGKNTGVGCHFLLQCMKVKSESEVAQSCPTPSDPMDCSPPGSSVHGIFYARVLEWGAIAFSEATVHEVSKSQTWLRTHVHAHTHVHWWAEAVSHSHYSMCLVWSTAHIIAQLVFVWWTNVWISLRPEFKEKWNTEPKFQGTMWACQDACEHRNEETGWPW